MTTHVAIIGAGIAGLSAAYKLKRAQDAGHDIGYTVYEASPRVGGQLWTDRAELLLPGGQTGAIIADGGSDSYLTSKQASIIRVARMLGLADQLTGTDDSSKQTYIVKDGKLVPLPDGIMMFAPTKILPMVTTRLYSWSAKFRMALDLIIPRKRMQKNNPAGTLSERPHRGEAHTIARQGEDDLPDEAIGSLVRRRLGNECLQRLAEPLVGGVNGSDPETMSTKATYPMLLDMEQRYGSLIRGFLAQRKQVEAMKKKHPPQPGQPQRTFFSSCKQGLGTLTDAMAAELGECVHTSTEVTRITRTSDGRYLLSIRENATFALHSVSGSAKVGAMSSSPAVTADAVIIATPAWVAGELIDDFAPDAAELLGDIPHSSCATIITAFSEADAPFAKNWHGILAPAIEGQKVTGISLVSSKWPGRAPQGTVLLRGFVGGARDTTTHELPDDELIELVCQTYRNLLGLVPEAKPLYAKVFRFPRAMPQYLVGHLDRMDALTQIIADQPGIALAGAAYSGVGVPNCLESGEEAACKVLLDAGVLFCEESSHG